MKLGLIMKCLLAMTLVVSLSGCLTQRTISSGGNTVSTNYVWANPFKPPGQ